MIQQNEIEANEEKNLKNKYSTEAELTLKNNRKKSENIGSDKERQRPEKKQKKMCTLQSNRSICETIQSVFHILDCV